MKKLIMVLCILALTPAMWSMEEKVKYHQRSKLHEAAAAGDLKEVKKRVGEGVNKLDHNGESPLHVAARAGHLKIVEFLLSQGADAAATNNDGATPAHVAVHNGHYQIAQILGPWMARKMTPEEYIQNILGPRLRARGISNDTFLSAGKAFGEALKMPQEADSQPSSLHEAIERGRVNEAAKFIEDGANINARSSQGETPLEIAVRKGFLELVKLLLSEGVELRENKAILSCAAKNDRSEIIDYLLQLCPANKEWQEFLDDALITASKNGCVRIVELLLKKGADANAADSSKVPALHLAAQEGHEKILSLLIEKEESDILALQPDGSTLLHAAAASGNSDVCSEVLRYLVMEQLQQNSDQSDDDVITQAILKASSECFFFDVLCSAGEELGTDKAIRELCALAMQSIKSLCSKKNKFGQTPSEGAVIKDKELAKLLSPITIGLPMIVGLLENWLEKEIKDSHFKGDKGFAQDLLHDIQTMSDIRKLKKDMSSQKKDVLRQLAIDAVRNAIQSGAISDPQGLFIELAYQGAEELQLDCLLANGVDINACNEHGYTALHMCLRRGHLKLAKFLISKGANIHAQTKRGETPLVLACYKGHKEIVKLLLTQSADVQIPDSEGNTPLHFAVQEGYSEIVTLLFEYGAQVDPKVKANGRTPLLFAAQQGHKDIVQKLLKEGAEVNGQDTMGYTALHLASYGGYLEIVTLLLSRGADVAAKDKESGFTALHIASEEGHEGVVKALIKKGAALDAQSDTGMTPLLKAALRGHDKVVDFLLKCGADVTISAENDVTALHAAALQGNKKCAEYLLSSKADPNAKLTDGCEALYLAVRNNHTEIAKLLILQGADVNAQNSGKTALHVAAFNGNQECVTLLLKHKADPNRELESAGGALLIASSGGHLEIVKVLAKGGAEIDATDKDGQTALHVSAENGHLKIVEFLLSHGAHINAKTNEGETPLRCAARGEHEEVVTLLLERGAELDEQWKANVLVAAAKEGSVDTVRQILQKGAQPNTCDEFKVPVVYLAALGGHKEVVTLLIESGADFSAADPEGNTILHAAVASGSYDASVDMLGVLVKNAMQASLLREALSKVVLEASDSCFFYDVLRLAGDDVGTEKAILKLAEGVVDCIDSLKAKENKSGDTPSKVAYDLLQQMQGGNAEYAQIVQLLHSEYVTIPNAVELIEKWLSGEITDPHFAGDIQFGKDLLHDLKTSSAKKLKMCAWCKKPKASKPCSDCKKVYYCNEACQKEAWDLHKSVCSLLDQKNDDAFQNVKQDEGYSLGSDEKASKKNLQEIQEKFFKAAKSGAADDIEQLLSAGASINEPNKKGFTVLHTVCHRGHKEAVKILLEQGADLEAMIVGEDVRPLHLACLVGHKEVVELLLGYGVNLEAKAAGTTPLYLACQNGHTDIVELLLNKGAEKDTIKDGAGFTPLLIACSKGHTEVVNLLLEQGADTEIKDFRGTTPLYVACQNGHTASVKLLLSKGANVETPVVEGATPLRGACQGGHIEIVKMLLKQGANVDVKDNNGITPLLVACYDGHEDVVKVLLEHGANKEVKTTDGITPLDVARKNGYVKVRDLLLSSGDTSKEEVVVKRCAACNKTGALKRCGQCKKVYFCNRECQKRAWPAHKQNCKKN